MKKEGISTPSFPRKRESIGAGRRSTIFIALCGLYKATVILRSEAESKPVLSPAEGNLKSMPAKTYLSLRFAAVRLCAELVEENVLNP